MGTKEQRVGCHLECRLAPHFPKCLEYHIELAITSFGKKTKYSLLLSNFEELSRACLRIDSP
jgi:hypothetical protein